MASGRLGSFTGVSFGSREWQGFPESSQTAGPLSSSVDAGNLVRDGALGGNDQYLVVAYEFVPTAGDVDGYV